MKGEDKLKVVYGRGLNDVACNKNGKYYKKWHSMMTRCYSERFKKLRETYINCCVCEEWLTFSNFKSWMEKQDWEGKYLDKDLLGDGKLYSPNTCCFIKTEINLFITDNKAKRGAYLLGVDWKKQNKKYRARCRDPFIEFEYHLGYFTSELEAHKAWQAKKHEYACMLADLQEDERVAKALRERYAPDKDWTRA